MRIEDIYDAAFDRDRFAPLIGQLAGAFGAQAGFIGWSGPEIAGFQWQHGNDPAWLERYVTTYHRHDVLRPLLHALPEGECGTAWPHLQDPAVRAGVFFRDYLAPQGIVDNLAVNVLKRPGIMAHVALLRRAPAGPFGDADRGRLATLVPHLRRAIHIQSRLMRAADHLAGARALAGEAGRGMLLLDAQHRLVEGEAPWLALLRLRIDDPVGDGEVGRAIARALATREPVALELAPDGDAAGGVPVLVEARTLDTARFGDLTDARTAACVVHVTRLDRPRPIALAALAELYRLTPTELRVLGDAVAHGDLTGIGERLGMARATTRTHLHRIYDKTGTQSFAGLSNLVHRFAPVAGSGCVNR